MGCCPVGAAGIAIGLAPGVTTVVLSGPAGFGFEALPVFMFSAPGGKLFAGCGALDAAFGAGGDAVAPLCAKAGVDRSSNAAAETSLFMARFPVGLEVPPDNASHGTWFGSGCNTPAFPTIVQPQPRSFRAGRPMTDRKLMTLVPAFVLALAACTAAAAPTACPQHFQGGQAPVVLNPRLVAGSRALCFQAFAVLHSGTTRTPLYSAEHLTRDRIEAARGLPREGEFHPEPLLPPGQRAELEDYARSGFDRGHMAPSGDMPDEESQQESFSLANMVPQAPKLNRITWEGIESAVRKLAERQGEIFVVTGPVFQGAELQRVGDVIVPSHTFKAVLDPRRGLAAAYVAKNVDSAPWAVISMAQLSDLTGLDIFPLLSADAKASPMRLPNPTPHGYGQRRQGAAR